MKSILISIKPEWVAKILSGEKTVEIRKTAPGCDLPIEVLIYCTKGGRPLVFGSPVSGYVSEKYVQTLGWNHKEADEMFGSLNGKVVARFTLKSIHKYDWRLVANPFFKVRGSCLTYSQLREYATDPKGEIHDLYGWNISDLEIFDEPKELSDFKSYKKNVVNTKINGMVFETELDNSLTKAPQAWCYVEER